MNTNNRGLFLVMPNGTSHGWGVCGRYLAEEFSKIVKLEYVSTPFEFENIGNHNQYEILSKCFCPVEQLEGTIDTEGRISVNSPVIQAITGKSFEPYLARIKGTKTIGYTFFEDNILSAEDLKRADNYYDLVVTGSSWCEEMLKSYGFSKTKTVIQGIDQRFFNYTGSKDENQDAFVIFSGGKLEFRKGQDLVIRAVKVLQDRYKDVVLVTSWYNNWPNSLSTMAFSPYINFEMIKGDHENAIKHLLLINGLDIDRTIVLPHMRNNLMANIYKSTDIGLFPNRCEGGTNLVLMEYMACGRPVVASNLTGHKDVVDEKYALLVSKKRDLDLKRGENIFAKWPDPDLDEIIDKLDYAYNNREFIQKMGDDSATAMRGFTWEMTALSFYGLIL